MAGTTNLIQFNPAQANQETDAQYAADPLVTGGIPVDGTLPSPFLNKVWYQASTFAAAFNAALTQKGYSPSDANLATLQAVYSNILTDADILPDLIAVTYSSTMSLDASKANGWQITLFGNASLSLVNAKPGQVYRIVLVQDNSGGRSVSYQGALAANGVQPDGTPGYVSILSLLCGTDSVLRPCAPMMVATS